MKLKSWTITRSLYENKNTPRRNFKRRISYPHGHNTTLSVQTSEPDALQNFRNHKRQTSNHHQHGNPPYQILRHVKPILTDPANGIRYLQRTAQ